MFSVLVHEEARGETLVVAILRHFKCHMFVFAQKKNTTNKLKARKLAPCPIDSTEIHAYVPLPFAQQPAASVQHTAAQSYYVAQPGSFLLKLLALADLVLQQKIKNVPKFRPNAARQRGVQGGGAPLAGGLGGANRAARRAFVAIVDFFLVVPPQKKTKTTTNAKQKQQFVRLTLDRLYGLSFVETTTTALVACSRPPPPF